MNRQHSRRCPPAWWLALAALAGAVATAATAVDRFAWLRLCERICGPYALPAQVETVRRSIDWATPLAWSLCAAAVLALALVHARLAPGRGARLLSSDSDD
ncbi:MAG: hypothetical protein MUC68_17595 [Burkholderiaceae bacterium]|jgi:hypothetical protein|nr:hypothetical protein [Burkholderiaceae bacterium]